MNKPNATVVIVESPTKIKALSKYLGGGFETIASVGHVRDLPENELGVAISNQFAPTYQIIRGKEKTVRALQKAATGRAVLLATDPDREGEAIAWHIAELIRKNAKSLARIEFEEITKSAVLAAIKQPREIDRNRVDAQQARRVLDRLVGYLVSPLLWKIVKTGISAGRVQSVALRLVSEREEEILAFVTEEYWTVEAAFAVGDGEVKTRLVLWDGEKAENLTAVAAQEAVEFGIGKTGIVVSFESKQVRKSPPPPFTTSTLQQAASTKLGFGVRRTINIAQQLYEGVELPQEGPVGLITYMRTDSVRLAGEAITALRWRIVELFGAEYLPTSPRQYKVKAAAQDAHEAIRPTDPSRHPDSIREFLSPEQAKLYDLIWRRTMACQMAAARFERQTADIDIHPRAVFRANGQRLLFDGYLKLYGRDDEEEESGLLPAGLAPDAVLLLLRIERSQHFTEPKQRYTEATLVKELDERGIGRPSTYAAIVQTLFDRDYIQRVEKKLQPTSLGRIVSRLLTTEFPDVFDVAFTSRMENELDGIADGNGVWQEVIGDLYRPLEAKLDAANKHLPQLREIAFLSTEESCPNGHPQMQLRIGRFGPYLRCGQCNATKNIAKPAPEGAEAVETSAEPCEKCGGKMMLRKGRFGSFLGCSNYPKCDNIRKLKAAPQQDSGKLQRAVENADSTMESPEGAEAAGISAEPCEKCGGKMMLRKGRFGSFLGCSNYPKCNNIRKLKATPQQADDKAQRPDEYADLTMESVGINSCLVCGSPMKARRGKYGPFFSCSRYPKCKSVVNVRKTKDGTWKVITPRAKEDAGMALTKASISKRPASGKLVSAKQFKSGSGTANRATTTEETKKVSKPSLRAAKKSRVNLKKN